MERNYFLSIFFNKFIIIILIMKIKMLNLVHKTLPTSLSLSNFLLHSCTTRSPSLVLTTSKGPPPHLQFQPHQAIFLILFLIFFLILFFFLSPFKDVIIYLFIKVCFHVYSVVLFPLLYLLEMKWTHQALWIFATTLCEETVWEEETDLLHIFRGFYGLDVYFTCINKFYQFKLQFTFI